MENFYIKALDDVQKAYKAARGRGDETIKITTFNAETIILALKDATIASSKEVKDGGEDHG